MATVSPAVPFSMSSSSSFSSHFPTRMPFLFSINRQTSSGRSSTIRAAIPTAPTPAPTPTTTPATPVTSSSRIVLVDKLDADKVNRLKSNYLEKIVPILMEEFGYKNIHEVPRLEKIVVNCGMGDAEQNSKGLEAAIKDLSVITGQRPVKTKAKKSIASFKLREGTTVGIAVTLRGTEVSTRKRKHPEFFRELAPKRAHKSIPPVPSVTPDTTVPPVASIPPVPPPAPEVMYSFLDRLINLGLPRTRDFQGVSSNSFDGYGNYSIGMRDQSVFPEIRYEALGRNRGMDVCITTSASTDNEAQRLLALLGMPFREGGGPTVVLRGKRKKAHHFVAKAKGKK